MGRLRSGLGGLGLALGLRVGFVTFLPFVLKPCYLAFAIAITKLKTIDC